MFSDQTFHVRVVQNSSWFKKWKYTCLKYETHAQDFSASQVHNASSSCTKFLKGDCRICWKQLNKSSRDSMMSVVPYSNSKVGVFKSTTQALHRQLFTFLFNPVLTSIQTSILQIYLCIRTAYLRTRSCEISEPETKKWDLTALDYFTILLNPANYYRQHSLNQLFLLIFWPF